MTNLKDFVEKEAIDLGGFDKFPQGDTFIDLEKTEVVKEDSPFKDKAGNLKPQYRLTTPTLKNLMCPVGVMAEIQKLASKISSTLLTKTIEQRAEAERKRKVTLALNCKEIICPHCNLIGTNKSNMNRYHFESYLVHRI